MRQDAATNPSVARFSSLHVPRTWGGELAVALTIGFLALIVACSFALRREGVMVIGDELSYDRALFLSINCATLTGFHTAIGFGDFNPDSNQGPAIIEALTVAGTLYALIVGGLAGVRALRLPFSDLQVLTAAVMAELLAVLVGTAALLVWGHAYVGDAFQESLCAFGNSAAIAFANSRKQAYPSYATFAAQGVLLPLAVVGGLGLPVLMDLYYRAIGVVSRLCFHTRTVLKLTAGIYLFATGVLFLAIVLHWASGVADPQHTGRTAFLAASTAALNTRTAGLPFDSMRLFPLWSNWLFVLLMMIGASSAGAAGGMKITTLYQLWTGFADVLRGRRVPRAFGIAGAWVGGYLAIAFASFATLCAIEPQLRTERVIFMTVSALSNVGMTTDPRDPLSIVGAGLYVLGLIALIGRLAPIAVLWWLARSEEKADVLVG